MADSLGIAPGLKLPIELATEATSLLATRGAGKSYTSAAIVEEVHAAGIQQVVLDPTGVYWGLRSSADGKQKGLPFFVLGGAHGDVPLEATAGALIADVVVDSQQSFVLDLSDFPTKGAQTRFVTEFAERLYRRKARSRTPLLIVLDEADEFAPQKPMRDEARMLGAIETLVRRGRSRGLGVTMITQRSAALNKNVLDLSETLIVLRTLGPRDREAIRGWINFKAGGRDDAGVLESLASLPTGTAWVWSPLRGILQKVAVRRIRTFDSYATPKPGEKRAEPTVRRELDVDKLGSQIAATAERAKSEDPRELQRRVRDLEKQLSQRTPEVIEKPVEIEVLVEVPPPWVAEELAAMVRKLRGTEPKRIGTSKRAVATAVKPAQPSRAAEVRKSAPPRPSGDVSVSSSQQRILDALAWLASVGVRDAQRTQLALLADQSPRSSGYSNNLGALRTAGLIDYPSQGRVSLTDAGERAAAAPSRLPTTADLHAAVLSKVSGSQARILQTLIHAYPDEVDRAKLAELSDQSATSSGYSNNLGALRSLGFIDYPDRGKVVATAALFLESR